MARRGDPDVELAERTYRECWDQFQSWASRHTSEVLRFDPPSNLDDEDEEEPDEDLFHINTRSNTVCQTKDDLLRASYYDPVEIDLEDNFLEPTRAPISTHWMNSFTAELIPQYGSFSHIRQNNYIRGDVWTHKATKKRIRILTGEDQEVELEIKTGETGGKGKGKKGEEQEIEPPVETKETLMDFLEVRKRVRSRKLVNLEMNDHLAINQESMPFIPPEMKRRSQRQKLLSYEASFVDIEAWEHFGAHWDNNEDIIGAEAVRRLLYIHQMTEEAVDRTKTIPQDISKLYHFLRHRTYPALDNIFPRDPPLPSLPLDEWAQKDKQATLESRIREKAFNICYKMNCQGIMCPTHYTARDRALTEQEAHETQEAQEADGRTRRGRGPQTPRWGQPESSALKLFTQFKREKRTRCGENCFYSLGVPEHGDLSFDVTETDSDPDARTQADIETIWKVDPDAIPCDVAELSWHKVTCRQAYNIRNKLYSFLAEPEPDDDDPGIEERRGGHSGSTRRKVYPALEECDHPGPAVLIANSAAEDANANHLPKLVYANTTRSVRKVVNVLNPDWSVIQNCAKDADHDGGPCTNVAIMMKHWKPTVVKPSQYGNGLFLAGRATAGELISDYMGDVCLPRTSLRRSLIAGANGRNYLFDIPNYNKVSIDAGYAGNESRFANHPSNGVANCSARYIWSGDEKHIALYATGHLWDGNELFLNYGNNYWHSEAPEGDYGGESRSEEDRDGDEDDIVEISSEGDDAGDQRHDDDEGSGYTDESQEL